jgi:hypothetical protein
MEKLNNLKLLVDLLQEDGIKFYEKGNSAAGTRLRKNLQEIKKLAQEIRLQISEQKKK